MIADSRNNSELHWRNNTIITPIILSCIERDKIKLKYLRTYWVAISDLGGAMMAKRSWKITHLKREVFHDESDMGGWTGAGCTGAGAVARPASRAGRLRNAGVAAASIPYSLRDGAMSFFSKTRYDAASGKISMGLSKNYVNEF
ncbi:hypothetical protein ACRBEV_18375 [Methylobacterium phyllosphaerae]